MTILPVSTQARVKNRPTAWAAWGELAGLSLGSVSSFRLVGLARGWASAARIGCGQGRKIGMEGDGMEGNVMAGGNVENAAICGGMEGGDVTGGIIAPHVATSPPWPSYPSAPNDREIATLSQTAQHTFTKARAKAQDMGWLALDRDLSVTRAQAARMRAVPYGEPNRKAIAQLWIDAEARWSGYAADGIPQVVVDGAMGISQGPAPQSQAPRIITMLAGRGVMVTLNTDGQLLATPAGMLTDIDKRLVQENAIELKRILASAEIIA